MNNRSVWSVIVTGWGEIFKLTSLIRIKPFDINTAEGRSHERLRKVFWTATSSALARGVSVLTVLISVPLTLKYLGAERYGLWMTITSFIAFLGFADLGIGNVLVNVISKSSQTDDTTFVKKSVTSSLFFLFVAAGCLGIIFAISYQFIDWNKLFNLSSYLAKQEVGPSLILFVICFLTNLPLSIIPRIQMGYQEGYICGIWQGISSLIGLALLAIIIRANAGLPWLVFAITGSATLGNLLNGISLFLYQRPWLLPKWKDVSIVVAKSILGVGLLFLFIQTANAFIFASDNIIISNVLGPDSVTTYSIPSKLYALVPTLIYIVLAPLWPAYGEANARGDAIWAKKTFLKAVTITALLCLLSSIFLVTYGKDIIKIWAGPDVPYSIPLMIFLGIWTTLQSLLAAIALYLNALNKIRFQTCFAITTAILVFLIKYKLAESIGLIGVVIGNIAVSSLLMLLPYSLYLLYRFSEHSEVK